MLKDHPSQLAVDCLKGELETVKDQLGKIMLRYESLKELDPPDLDR